VRWPPENRDGTPVDATAAGEYRESANQKDPTAFNATLRSDYGAAGDVTYSIAGAPQTKEGVRVSYLLSSDAAAAPVFAMGSHTFVPQVGFTKLEQLDDGIATRTWTLYDEKPIEGCPFTGPTPLAQICGFTIQ
jgi:hypothetical protein